MAESVKPNLSTKQLGKIITQLKTEKVSYVWEIQKFSFYNKKTRIDKEESIYTSPIFPASDNMENVSGLTWMMELRFVNSNCLKFYLKQVNPDITFYKAEVKVVYGKINCVRRTSFFNNSQEISFMVSNGDITCLLFDDTLLLECKIHVALNEHFSTQENYFESENAVQSIPQNPLQQFMNKKDMCDVVLVTPLGKELNAHKILLAAHSEIFYKMFNTDCIERKENKVHITDIGSSLLEQMLEFMYAGAVKNMDLTLCTELLAVADKYNVAELKNYCIRYIRKELTQDNFLHILSLADLYKVTELKEIAMKFLTFHRSAMIKMDLKQLNNLQPETFEELMKICFSV